MSFLKLSRICLVASSVLVAASLLLLFVWPPRLSIEFAGGTLMELRLPENTTKADLEQALLSFKEAELGNTTITVIHGDAGASMLVRSQPLGNEEHIAILAHIEKSIGGPVQELKFTTIGPSVSASLKQKTFTALALASVAIIVYLAIAFWKLPKKLNPWKFGILAVVAFIHDIAITTGIFVILSHYTSFEMDTLFITALLTILAYSANDTIVIFDRIRANVLMDQREDLATTVKRGLQQSVSRTFGTTVAGLIMLVALYLFGPTTIHWFMLALIVGTIIGTYSSYFIAAPLLIYWK